VHRIAERIGERQRLRQCAQRRNEEEEQQDPELRQQEKRRQARAGEVCALEPRRPGDPGSTGGAEDTGAAGDAPGARAGRDARVACVDCDAIGQGRRPESCSTSLLRQYLPALSFS
jgi:hypothetical protein